MTDIVPSDREPTVVERWLKKLVASNDEHDRHYKIGKYKQEGEPRNLLQRKPRKPKKVKEKRERVPVVERSRREERMEAQNIYETHKKKGFVYLMFSANGYHKIGISKNINIRCGDLNRQFPVEIRVVHFIASNDYRRVEKFLHNKYAGKRVQHEWFDLNQKDVQWITSLKDYDLD